MKTCIENKTVAYVCRRRDRPTQCTQWSTRTLRVWSTWTVARNSRKKNLQRETSWAWRAMTSRIEPTSTNVPWIRNWWTLLHMRRTDAACAVCALTSWQHFSWHVMAAILNVILTPYKISDSDNPYIGLFTGIGTSFSLIQFEMIEPFWRWSPQEEEEEEEEEQQQQQDE